MPRELITRKIFNHINELLLLAALAQRLHWHQHCNPIPSAIMHPAINRTSPIPAASCIYYNSACPLCNAGIAHWQSRLAQEGVCDVEWIDVHSYPERCVEVASDLERVRERLHVIAADGTVAIGADALAALLALSARTRLLAATLGLPGIRWLAQAAYNTFARLLYRWNRQRAHCSSKQIKEYIVSLALKPVDAGQLAFTRTALALYDPFVLGATCHLLWRCSTQRILKHYAAHVTGNHLEVGVGTGFFLERCRFPTPSPRLALLDLNRNCLERTATRLASLRPESYLANVLEPIGIDAPEFDSIALNYVLHCLPCAFPEKGRVFANLKRLLRPGGVIFGATLVQDGLSGRFPASAWMRLFNARGVLNNRNDWMTGLASALNKELRDVQIEQIGCMALFSGRV